MKWNAKGSAGPAYRFTDKEDDKASGSIYIGARHYLPALGRWVSPDPLLLHSPGTLGPRETNPYQYTGGDPVNTFDPDGMNDWVARLAGAAEVGVAEVEAAAESLAPVMQLVPDEYKASSQVRKITNRALGDGTTESAAYQEGQMGAAALMIVAPFTGGPARAVGKKVTAAGNSLMRKVTAPIKDAVKKKVRNIYENCLRRCFVAGTLVMTSNGNVPIDDLEIGDLVWAADPETGEEGWRAVEAVHVREGAPIVRVEVGTGETAEVIETTDAHPFWTREWGWVPAGELNPGDSVQDVEGEWVSVVSLEAADQRERVWNLTVEGLSTFHVGEAGVLVHNCKPSLSAHKEALKKVHKELNLEKSLPPAKPGKYGSPQRGDSRKGYRLDPGHPNRPKGDPEEGPHINWWDYTQGKRGRGGRSGAVPIKEVDG